MILTYTGERLTTDIYNNTMVEHLHRYYFASEYVENKIVLDIACGEGFGTNLLSVKAQFVYGIDLSEEAIQHAQLKYNKQNINFIRGYAHKIPLEKESIDVVISFETIEHHDKHHEMIQECKRVLKKNGILIISSPDKKYYTDIVKNRNPFHIKELYQNEFSELISTYFANTYLLKQGIIRGTIIYGNDHKTLLSFYSGDYTKLILQQEIRSPQYNLIIASNYGFDIPNNSFFESDLVNKGLIEERNKYRKLYFNLYNSGYHKLGRILLKHYKLLHRFINKK